MLRVFEAPNPAEAHLLLGLLRSEGIHGEVRGEALFGTIKFAAFVPSIRPSVWIFDDRHREEALAIIARYESVGASSSLDAASWQCPHCAEVHEPQFTSCWKCGTAIAGHTEAGT